MSAEVAPMYRSRAFLAARGVLIWSEHRLPSVMYTAMYRTAFRAYRTGLETSYALTRRRRRRSGDWEGVRRADAVIKSLPFSLVGPAGLEATYVSVRQAMGRGVKGAIVECGVAQGGSSAVMALAVRDADEPRDLWLFDSFEGLPDPSDEDFDPTSGATGAHIRPLPKGSCLGTYEEVYELMHEVVGMPEDRVSLVKGWFQDTVSSTAPEIGPIAVLRLDGDWYDSTMVCLQGLYPQLEPGGVLIVDDYHSCYGSQRAVHEYLGDQGESDPLLVDDGSGGVIYIKP